MDWLRQIPIGQYVDTSGAEETGWLHRLDPRLKLAWTLAFLVTPVMAGPRWRLALVGLLLLVTLFSGVPSRIWRRSVPSLLALAALVGLLSLILPAAPATSADLQRPPGELLLAPSTGAAPPERAGLPWELARWGPYSLGPLSVGPVVVTRKSAELGINAATMSYILGEKEKAAELAGRVVKLLKKRKAEEMV